VQLNEQYFPLQTDRENTQTSMVLEKQKLDNKVKDMKNKVQVSYHFHHKLDVDCFLVEQFRQ
jgi:hypothetical protein